ncbi:hypothetical protein WJX72_005223 [[Myrmecia] bisecta]|uniref:Uncharacterized protein n=1 Tax=[Myrmecia] bisecta TaxID=41462 RepID=A0AAW1Q0X5_9CHLO
MDGRLSSATVEGATISQEEESGWRPELDKLAEEQDATREDIQALKRLQREVFADLLSIRTRLTALQPDEDGSGSGNGYTLVNGMLRRLPRGPGRAKVEISGETEAAAALLWSQEEAGPAAQNLQGAGIGLGTALRLKIQSKLRKGADLLLAQCCVSSLVNPEQAYLQKVLYKAQVSPQLRVLLAGLGGRGEDAAPTLNPQAGLGLTRLMHSGCNLHQQCGGTGVGATYSMDDISLSAAHFLTSLDEPTASSSSLLQFSASPTPAFSTALVLVRHACRAPRLHPQTQPTSPVANASAGGSVSGDEHDKLRSGMAFCGLVGPAKGRQHGPTAAHLEAAQSEGQCEEGVRHALGLTGAVNIADQFALAGWASMLKPGEEYPREWGLTFSPYPDGSGNAWGLSVGRCSCSNRIAMEAAPLVAEASLQMAMGDGLILTPGLVFVKRPEGSTATFAIKSQWQF